MDWSDLQRWKPDRSEPTEWKNYVRTVAPIGQIMTLEQAKRHIHVQHNDDDDYISSLIDVATAFIEGPSGIGIALKPQSWKVTLEGLPRRFTLKMAPLKSITSITVNGNVIDPTSYRLVNNEIQGNGLTNYPYRYFGHTVVEFEAGYDTVPADLIHAAKLLLGHYYLFREPAVAGGTTMEVRMIPLAVDAILDRYRRY